MTFETSEQSTSIDESNQIETSEVVLTSPEENLLRALLSKSGNFTKLRKSQFEDEIDNLVSLNIQ
jgi:hypothetical protein